MAADMRKDHTGRNKYQIHFLPEQHRTLLPDCCKDYPKAAEIHGKTWELCGRIQPRPEQAFMFHINLARCYIAFGKWTKQVPS